MIQASFLSRELVLSDSSQQRIQARGRRSTSAESFAAIASASSPVDMNWTSGKASQGHLQKAFYLLECVVQLRSRF